ncbi:MAG: hypothetical protein LBM77_00170 [Spirochaetaceae bacterium]|jgi:hypothetical protein|nr:hypothetical protein [Spirochaetaceae bacterium]
MKKLFRILAGLACGNIVMALSGCFTFPAAGPQIVQTYAVTQMPPAGTLQGKKAVVFDLLMGPRALPTKATANNMGGGLGGLLLGAGTNAIAMDVYMDSAKDANTVASEQALWDKQAKVLYTAIAAKYTAAFGAETVEAKFDIGSATMSLDFIEQNSDLLNSQISKACADNAADVALVMFGYMENGDFVAAQDSAPAKIMISVLLTDKDGNVFAAGKADSVSYMMKSYEKFVYNNLLTDVSANVVSMIPALGGNGEAVGTKEFVATSGVDRGDTREPGEGETVLVVKRIDKNSGWPIEVYIDKGTDDERAIFLPAGGEIRVIITVGSHTLAADVTEGSTKEKNDPISITATADPLNYTLSVKGGIGGGGVKDNERYTWVKQ